MRSEEPRRFSSSSGLSFLASGDRNARRSQRNCFVSSIVVTLLAAKVNFLLSGRPPRRAAPCVHRPSALSLFCSDYWPARQFRGLPFLTSARKEEGGRGMGIKMICPKFVTNCTIILCTLNLPSQRVEGDEEYQNCVLPTWVPPNSMMTLGSGKRARED